jgi:alpha-beta hydrolase superfamily lysophospholipase
MLCRSRTCLALALLGGLGVAPGFGADFKRVPFTTADGVELAGTYYPAAGMSKKDAIVLLLHNFDPLKGGDSHQDGWDHLAGELQAAGYSVFTFDFRGFGGSKTVDPQKFWRMPHNRGAGGLVGMKLPESIDHKKFSRNYYPYLVNDITAAKAFLDRKNDDGELNTSNLIVIGAGNGATLGAMWLLSQCRLHRDRASLVPFQQPALDDPEGKDVAAAVWLSINPQFPGGNFPLRGALREVGRDCKINMAFVFGKRDNASANFARNMISEIRGVGGKQLNLNFTGPKEVDTALAGSKLLDESLPTEKWIIESYLNPVIENRGVKERRRREIDRYAFYWTNGRAAPGRPGILAKRPGDEMPLVINPDLFSRIAGP